MRSALRVTLVCLTWAFPLLAIGCQWLTGANERRLVPKLGDDGGSGAPATGGAGGEGIGGAGAVGGAGGVAATGGAAGSTAGSANGGAGSSDAGPDASDDAGDGATSPDVAVPSCSGTYVDWFQSSFAAVDREVVGTADRPSMPWNTLGDLEILGARLSGKGTATASQGQPFDYDGLRLRFKGRFTDSSQYVGVALNSQRDGGMGLRVDVMARGTVILTENGVQRGTTTLSPLALDRDWFLEVELDASRATVRLDYVNYPGQAGSVTLATIENAPVANSATGKYLSIALSGAAELPSSVDEVFVARCGLAPPAYQWILKDEFERQDSDTLGNADFPPTSEWSTLSTAVKIARRMLYFREPDGGAATVPFDANSFDDGIRLRFTFHRDLEVPQFLVGAIYNYSTTMNSPTFTFGSNDGTSTDVVVGSVSRNFPVTIARQVTHYVQIDLQGDVAVLTIRTVGYTGPILAIHASRLPPLTAATVQEVTLMANHDIGIEEMELARYGL